MGSEVFYYRHYIYYFFNRMIRHHEYLSNFTEDELFETLPSKISELKISSKLLLALNFQFT